MLLSALYVSIFHTFNYDVLLLSFYNIYRGGQFYVVGISFVDYLCFVGITLKL